MAKYLIEALREAAQMVEEYSCRASTAHVANEASAVAQRCRAAIKRAELTSPTPEDIEEGWQRLAQFLGEARDKLRDVLHALPAGGLQCEQDAEAVDAALARAHGLAIGIKPDSIKLAKE